MLSKDSLIPNIVIGSGPTGYATALSLLDQGKTVFIIDPSLPLFPITPNSSQVSAQKGLFGSLEMYKLSPLAQLTGATSGIAYSEVRGGLSTTWGAGLQVYPDSHFENWPCKGVGMKNSYQRLLSKIAHVYSEDALVSRFSWPPEVDSSQPSESKLGKLAESSTVLEKILIGHARLAISQRGNRKCQLCSGCLEGCPYDSIFNSGNELLRIAETNNRLQLLSGFVHQIVVPTSSDQPFQIKSVNTNGKLLNFEADNVYLSLGAVGTPALLLRSNIIETKVSINDSQVFYSAFFSRKKMYDANGTSLAKLFVVNKTNDSEDFHLSLYSPNPEITKRIEQKLRDLVKIKIRVPMFISKRIIAGIGFIEPKHSGKIILETQNQEISLWKSTNSSTAKKIHAIVAILGRDLRRIGLFKIPFSTQIPEVGAGFHSGGGLLEVVNSHESDFDEFGRLRQNKKLMVTDASAMVFNIAGPHTLTAMAHAYRNAQIN